MDKRFERFNNAAKLPSTAARIRAFIDQVVGDFEVFCIVTDKALTTDKMSFDEAYTEMEALAMAQGSGNGIDIRRVAA